MWPFGPKQEVRNYTASVLDAFHSVATSGKGASAEGTFAVESGVRLLADVISTARIEGPAPIVDALKPILGSMARELLLRGECAYWIQPGVSGSLRLSPVSIEDVAGGPDPDSWAFKVLAPGPSRSTRTVLSNSQLLRPTYSTNNAAPWQGIGPLQRAGVSASFLGALESAFADEAKTTVGTILPIDHPHWAQAEEREGIRARLSQEFAGLRGRLQLFLAHPGRGQDGTPRNVPRSDLNPVRLGPRYDVATAEARSQVCADALSSLGVPPVLFDVAAAGTSRREAWRQCFSGSVIPLAAKLQAEIGSKLAPVTFSWDRPAYLDQVGRASVATRLNQAGVSTERSLELAGLGD